MRVLLSTLLAAALGVMTWFLPLAWAQTTFPAPTASATTITPAANARIITANPTRRSIRICNTGSTNPVWIWPGALSPAVSDYVIAPISSNVISCYTPPNGVVGGAGAQWNAGAVTTTVSVEEW